MAKMRLSNRRTNLQPSLLSLRSALQSSRQQLAQAAKMNHSVDLKPHIELVLGPMYSGKSSVRPAFCGESRAFVAMARQPKSALKQACLRLFLLLALPLRAMQELIRRVRRFTHAKKKCLLIKYVGRPPVALMRQLDTGSLSCSATRHALLHHVAHGNASLAPICRFRFFRFRYAKDTRYSDDSVSTHDRSMMVAVPALKLVDVGDQIAPFDVIAM
jgi:hypothetical protein